MVASSCSHDNQAIRNLSHPIPPWQVIGGILADKVGAKKVLGFGVVWWSLATIATPFAAQVTPYLKITSHRMAPLRAHFLISPFHPNL